MNEYNPNVFYENPGKNIFIKRIDCWEDTKKQALKLDKPLKSIKYKYDPNFKFIFEFEKTDVSIINIDTIECGLKLKENGWNPLILNLADDCISGGCVNIGSGAQEESIFRVSNIFMTLIQTPDFYPIQKDEAILSSKIKIIKQSEKNNWKMIKDPQELSIITCPALKYPSLENGKLKQCDILTLKNKIRLILQIAYTNNNDTVIFGAMGCGAWRNPCSDVAQVFKEVLDEYQGVFSKLYFAILKNAGDTYVVKNHNVQKDNYDIFKEIFSE